MEGPLQDSSQGHKDILQKVDHNPLTLDLRLEFVMELTPAFFFFG